MPKRRTITEAMLLFKGDPGRCWRLPAGAGGPHGNGYYKITVSGQRWFAHRLAYVLFVGPIPEGTEVDHQCHNRDANCPGGETCPHRGCVNPDHLEAVPHRVNALRGKSLPAANARRANCANGHELTIQGPSSTKRHCPTCRLLNRIARGETSGSGHLRERTHCPQGHPYDDANTYVARKTNGSPRSRMCRACGRDRATRRRHAKGGSNDLSNLGHRLSILD